MVKLYLNDEQGGFVNGGVNQIQRPNCFITPQGRCAEHILYTTIRETINTRPAADIDKHNDFAGNIDVVKLDAYITEVGPENVPLILMTVTNNNAAGQPVSMQNLRKVSKIADKHNVPVLFDACRFAENAYFIKKFEQGYSDKSIAEIVREMFTYCDVFTISLKKDGLANIGGLLAFRDKGRFHKHFSYGGSDVGVLLKEKQIMNFGNDSYGGLSGHDLMSAAVGLEEVLNEDYLGHMIQQVSDFAMKLHQNGIPAVLPAGGHAVYIDMDKFFEGTDMKKGDFGGLGVTIELIRLYGIRISELGPFAFEWDNRSEEDRKEIMNLVRLALPRNAYSEEHINYTVAALCELHRKRESIPKVKVVRGQKLRLRQFQSGLMPIYPNTEA